MPRSFTPPGRRRGLVNLIVALILAASSASAAAPTLESDGDPQSGFVTLSWTGSESMFQLQEATSASFADGSIRYEGEHHSTVISGLPNGTYHYRTRQATSGAGWSAWSEPVAFTVTHHSLARAGTLFGIGALVFGATVAFVVLRSREEE